MNSYLIPKEYQSIDQFHPEIKRQIKKYDEVKKYRNPEIVINPLIRSTYLQDNKFKFRDHYLKLEDPNNSLSSLNESDEITTNFSNDRMALTFLNSNESNKRLKTSIEIRNIDDDLLNMVSLFKHFELDGNISIQNYLSTMEQYLVHNYGNTDVILTHFHVFLRGYLNRWFIQQSFANFDELKNNLISQTNHSIYKILRALMSDKNEFIIAMSKFECDNLAEEFKIGPYRTVYNLKYKYLKAFFNMEDDKIRLFLCGNLSEANFNIMKPLINSEESFVNGLKLLDLKVKLTSASELVLNHYTDETCNILSTELAKYKGLEAEWQKNIQTLQETIAAKVAVIKEHEAEIADLRKKLEQLQISNNRK